MKYKFRRYDDKITLTQDGLAPLKQSDHGCFKKIGSNQYCLGMMRNDHLTGYVFEWWPQAYLVDGRFVPPVPEPDHLIEVEGRPPMQLHDLLRQLAQESLAKV